MTKIEMAKHFAIKAHGDQKRKYTGEPYVNHCFAVSEIVSGVTMDENIIIASILHDVIEDTKITAGEIRSIFGERVAELVLEVTDISKPSDGNRKIRKEIDRNHLKLASAGGQTIKLADLINNTETIVKYDKDFAKVYMVEKRELLKDLIYGHEALQLEAKRIVDEYFMQHETKQV